jgi:hypothetical protein
MPKDVENLYIYIYIYIYIYVCVSTLKCPQRTSWNYRTSFWIRSRRELQLSMSLMKTRRYITQKHCLYVGEGHILKPFISYSGGLTILEPLSVACALLSEHRWTVYLRLQNDSEFIPFYKIDIWIYLQEANEFNAQTRRMRLHRRGLQNRPAESLVSIYIILSAAFSPGVYSSSNGDE